MRIYNRQDFMKLPAGTIFAKGRHWCFDCIDVKGETLVFNGKNIDFYVHGFNWVNTDHSDEATTRLEDMKDKGDSCPMQILPISRNGMFNDDEFFLVYEKDDLEQLKKFIEIALSLTTC